jgi:hypothetical protein
MAATPLTITTWGATYDPLEADDAAQRAHARSDKRCAHDIFWDASENEKGKNGWSIPDRGALNKVVNEWSRPSTELSYAAINRELASRKLPQMTYFQNRVVKVTAQIILLGEKKGKSEFLFDKMVKEGCTITETTDRKLSASISAGFAGIGGSVSCHKVLSNDCMHIAYVAV